MTHGVCDLPWTIRKEGLGLPVWGRSALNFVPGAASLGWRQRQPWEDLGKKREKNVIFDISANNSLDKHRNNYILHTDTLLAILIPQQTEAMNSQGTLINKNSTNFPADIKMMQGWFWLSVQQSRGANRTRTELGDLSALQGSNALSYTN